MISAESIRVNARARFAKQANHVLGYALLILFTALFMLPLFWLLLSSLKLETEFTTIPIVFWPKPPQFINYVYAVTRYPFMKYVLNSVTLTVPSTLLTVLASALGGFGFARRRARGRNGLFVLLLSMLMVPRVVTIIPTFIIFSRVGLVNNYWPWILWGIGGSPYHIFLFRQFFAAIPKDLEDAAEMDGCTDWRIFWQIFLPNSGAVLATSAIFHFRYVWGDWFAANIFLSDGITTLAVKLAKSYVDPMGQAIVTHTLAATFIYMSPVVIFFFLAQKYIIQGVVTSGIKG